MPSPFSIKFYKHPHCPPEYTPAYGSKGAACIDLPCAVAEGVTIPAGEAREIGTGISLALPDDFCAIIWPRSGLARKFGIGIDGGMIDSDYRGELIALVRNNGKQDVTLSYGDRIAQLLLTVAPQMPFDLVASLDDLPATDRGDQGFGSTGA